MGFGRLNVIVASNNWGAGHHLQTKLKKLSKDYKFSVFYAGGWGFQNAVLIDEPKARLKMIQDAFKTAAKGNKEATPVDQK